MVKMPQLKGVRRGCLASYHYDNTPMQYTVIFHGCKNGNFQMKKTNIYLSYFCSNHRLWVFSLNDVINLPKRTLKYTRRQTFRHRLNIFLEKIVKPTIQESILATFIKIGIAAT